MVRYAKTAIVLGSVKEALLYFDHIIPISLFAHMYKWPGLTDEGVMQIVLPHLVQAPQFLDKLIIVNEALVN